MIRRIIRKMADAADRALFPLPDMPDFDCGFSDLVCCTCGMDPITCTHSGPGDSHATSTVGDSVVPGDGSGAGEVCIHANCDEPGVIPVNYRNADSWLYCPDHFAAYGDITDLFLSAAGEIEHLDSLRGKFAQPDMRHPAPARHRLIAALRNIA